MPSPLVFYRLLMSLKPFLPNLTLTTDPISMWILYPPKIGNNNDNSKHVLCFLYQKITFKCAKLKYYYLILRKPNKQSQFTKG